VGHKCNPETRGLGSLGQRSRRVKPGITIPEEQVLGKKLAGLLFSGEVCKKRIVSLLKGCEALSTWRKVRKSARSRRKP
jgi:hypothetical protein